MGTSHEIVVFSKSSKSGTYMSVYVHGMYLTCGYIIACDSVCMIILHIRILYMRTYMRMYYVPYLMKSYYVCRYFMLQCHSIHGV